MASGSEIIQQCKDHIGQNTHNCSAFVRDVAIALNINDNNILGTPAAPVLANQQVARLINHPLWNDLGKGDAGAKEAAKYADWGYFVVAGWINPHGHGHVAVVVTGILQNGWPHAYWGHLGGAPGYNKGLRYSFGSDKRPQVHFFARAS